CSPPRVASLAQRPPPPQMYTLSLHDALPICRSGSRRLHRWSALPRWQRLFASAQEMFARRGGSMLIVERFVPGGRTAATIGGARSEEHTSELQSRFDVVCRLLLEKRKRGGSD